MTSWAPSRRQLAELERVVATLRAVEARSSARGFVPHRPHPKQAEFLARTELEALYGGAAGGGKSDALLMAALEYVHVPGYTALLLRRTFADLAQPGALLDRAREWLSGSAAKWNERDRRWTFPSGAVVQFGYLDTPQDRFRYQGTAYQFIGWDELTQFAEMPYRYMFSRLRRLAEADVPLRVRGATNPGGIGHEWVRRRFIEPANPARPFVPALIDDNPSLDAASYRQSLAMLDASTRAQLEQGLWVHDAAGLVYHYDEGRNAIDVAPSCDHVLLALDFGATAPTSFSILGWRSNEPTVYVLRSWKRAGLSPGDAAAEIQELNRQHHFEAIVGDIGGLGKGYQLESQRRFHVPIEAAQKTNKLGYVALLNGDLEKGLIKVVRGACEQLTTEWQELPWNERHTGEAAGFDNHCADGVLYGWRRCAAFLEEALPTTKSRVDLLSEHEERLEEAEDLAAQEEAAGW